MRLINAIDYTFFETDHPDDYPYAILSHTWGDNEVSFQDMVHDKAQERTAWHKVQWTCELARDQGTSYVWVDTCCIDKSSSAELTEAINSMFEWYKKATVCYAYLGDLPESPNKNPQSARGKEQLQSDLGRCRWFSRGWTLQELIAPKRVEFYDQGWNLRGTKESLRFEISVITGIDMSVLAHSEDLPNVAVAKKMSWAANRHTTRVEDVAYSLLGIFDVNLALIYGEGARAFLRLQEAISYSTNDLSLFAWLEDDRNPDIQSYYGLLAHSPRQFTKCGHFECIPDPRRHDRQFFTNTNRGVEFQALLKVDELQGDYLMPLYCRDAAQPPGGRHDIVAIRLVKTESGFVRHRAEKLFGVDDEAVYLAVDSQKLYWDTYPRSVRIAKTLSPAEMNRLHGQLQDAFQFIFHAPKALPWWMSTNGPLKGSDEVARGGGYFRATYHDQARDLFLTAGYRYFTGLAYVTLSAYLGVCFEILCGFWPDEPNRKPGGAGQNAKLRPWVIIQVPTNIEWTACFDEGTEETDKFRGLGDINAMKRELSYSRFLDRAGQEIRAALSQGKVLPTKVVLRKPPGTWGGNVGAGFPSDVEVDMSVASQGDDPRIHRVTIKLRGYNPEKAA